MKFKLFSLPLFFMAAAINFSYGQAHEQGDIALSPGISLGSYGFYRNSCDRFGVPLVLYADFSPHDYWSVGPYLGVFIGDGAAFNFGGRGNFHLLQILDDNISSDLMTDVLDVYLSMYLGFEATSHYCYKRNGNAFRGRIGAMAGLRWYFVEPVALMFELGGPPMGFTTFGVTFKL